MNLINHKQNNNEQLTLFLLGGGGSFLHNSKSIGLRLLKFSDFSYIPKALPLGLKPGFNTNCLSPQAHCLNEYFFLSQTKSLFWPSFSCQILIILKFLESLWHKKTDCISFAKKFCKLIAYFPSKEISTFLDFLNWREIIWF